MKDASKDLSHDSRAYRGKKPAENEEAKKNNATTKERDARCNEHEKNVTDKTCGDDFRN
jgi:hypothetical protein